ncbi:MAG: MFS transporter [Reichenbachiella sp.]
MNVVNSAIQYYFHSFRGFSKEVWWLALATLVNRAGAMVLPFLSLYLTSALDYSLTEVGWIMTFFGLGSFAGAWLGGEMTHKYGAYRTMIFSLLGSGLFFIILGQFQSFWLICFGMFTVALISDIFRPAVFVSLASYAKVENRIRAITLIRLAINLGFSLGPAVGGLIIIYANYTSLFWIDGITCISAGLIILFSLKERIAKSANKKLEKRHSHLRILTDARYMFFLLAVFIFSVIFVQYFSTIPVYYKSIRGLTEDEVGWLLSLNGIIIFLMEMPIIYALDKPIYSKFTIIVWGSILLSLSFIILFFQGWTGILVIGMLLATYAEILCFPFSNNYAMVRGGKGNEGRYMAYYSMTFSLSHVFGHNIGMHLSENYGYDLLFIAMTILALISGILFWIIGKKESSH